MLNNFTDIQSVKEKATCINRVIRIQEEAWGSGWKYFPVSHPPTRWLPAARYGCVLAEIIVNSLCGPDSEWSWSRLEEVAPHLEPIKPP